MAGASGFTPAQVSAMGSFGRTAPQGGWSVQQCPCRRPEPQPLRPPLQMVGRVLGSDGEGLRSIHRRSRACTRIGSGRNCVAVNGQVETLRLEATEEIEWDETTVFDRTTFQHTHQ